MTETKFKYDVFISYSHKDEEWVLNILLPALERHGLKVCIDYRDFVAGRPAIINMMNASEASRHTLLVLSPNWIESEWTLYESILSRTNDPAGLQRRTIPLLLENCSLPKFISMLSWVDFTDRNQLNIAWQSLFKSLSVNADSSENESDEYKQLSDAVSIYSKSIRSQIELARKDIDLKSPYKALLEYDIRDFAFFFGRETETKEMLLAINRSPLVILHAESGSGKTSLLKARIRPHLFNDGHLPLYIRPYQYPIDISIKRALLPELEKFPYFASLTLHDFAWKISKLMDGKWIVIILDQFEEVFTLQSPKSRERFTKQLAECLDDDLLPVRWIISLRGEWLSKLASFRPYIRNPLENNVFLKSLSREDASLAIRKPAELKDIVYDDHLVSTILNELGPQEVYPPELQIVCSALYEARDISNSITQGIYEKLGGTRGILQEHFNRVLNQKIPKDQKQLAQQVLSALVGHDGSRISRSKRELENELRIQETDKTRLDDVLTQLVDSHLIRMEETNDSHQAVIIYELAHDYLIDKIELDPSLQKRKIAQELLDQKIPYYSRDNLLLSSDELSLILPEEQWLHLSETAQNLIQESKDKLHRRRLQVFGAGIISLMFLIAALYIIARYVGKNLAGIVTPSSSMPQASDGGMNTIYLFWMFVILFAFIGWMRGGAKELLVAFGALIGLMLNHLLIKYVPFINSIPESDPTIFWIRFIILLECVYFGYQVIGITSIGSKARLGLRTARDRLQDALQGGFVGGLNGYLISGSVLFYVHVADSTFQNVITKPSNPAMVQAVNNLMVYMPPQLLGEPGIYFAFILVAIFVFVVYY